MVYAIIVAAVLSIVCLPRGNPQARGYDDQTSDRMARPAAALVRAEPDGELAEPGSPQLIDSDRDGVISEAEAMAHYRWLFGLLDRDRDRVILPAEFIQALGTGARDPARQEAERVQLRGLFQRLDRDGDRTVGHGEFLTACNAHFSSSDGDGDGRVSLQEFRSRRAL